MSTATEKPTVLRPPVKPSSMPIPKEEHIEEAPEGTPAPRQAAKPKPTCAAHCTIEEMPSGEGIATIIIQPDILKRLKNRSQGLATADYVWSYVIRPALESHVY